jgi:hypothetical protein
MMQNPALHSDPVPVELMSQGCGRGEHRVHWPDRSAGYGTSVETSESPRERTSKH